MSKGKSNFWDALPLYVFIGVNAGVCAFLIVGAIIVKAGS